MVKEGRLIKKPSKRGQLTSFYKATKQNKVKVSSIITGSTISNSLTTSEKVTVKYKTEIHRYDGPVSYKMYKFLQETYPKKYTPEEGEGEINK